MSDYLARYDKEEEGIKAIEIDPDGRYIILVKGASEYHAEQAGRNLVEWWKSGRPFFVLSVSPDIESVRLVRVDEKGE